MATINGNNRPNVLNGTPQDDLIRGFGGDDTLDGLGGNDILRGGDGNDTANGGFGNDELRGFNGSDTLNGQAGNDELHGENGSDRLDGGLGSDTLVGGYGADTLYGRAGDDTLLGTSDIFTDNFLDDFASDRLFGGDGKDHFFGSDASADRFFGENGNDVFEVNNDVAAGGAGNDRFFTSHAGGRLTGGAGTDAFSHNTILGGSSQDLVVTDFTTADNFGWSADGPEFAFHYDPGQVFDFFDSNEDGLVSSRDRSSTSPEGVSFSVRDTGPDLVLSMNEDSVTFRGLSAIADADWAERPEGAGRGVRAPRLPSGAKGGRPGSRTGAAAVTSAAKGRGSPSTENDTAGPFLFPSGARGSGEPALVGRGQALLGCRDVGRVSPYRHGRLILPFV